MEIGKEIDKLLFAFVLITLSIAFLVLTIIHFTSPAMAQMEQQNYAAMRAAGFDI